jgi:hypothetical protein
MRLTRDACCAVTTRPERCGVFQGAKMELERKRAYSEPFL